MPLERVLGVGHSGFPVHAHDAGLAGACPELELLLLSGLEGEELLQRILPHDVCVVERGRFELHRP